MILENLVRAGIQNGRRNERLTFGTLDPYPGTYIQAIGSRAGNGDGDTAPAKVGIALGPQYGTVGPSFIKSAAREALRAEGVELLTVLASRSTHRRSAPTRSTCPPTTASTPGSASAANATSAASRYSSCG